MLPSQLKNSKRSSRKSRAYRVQSEATEELLDWQCPGCRGWFAGHHGGPANHRQACPVLRARREAHSTGPQDGRYGVSLILCCTFLNISFLFRY